MWQMDSKVWTAYTHSICKITILYKYLMPPWLFSVRVFDKRVGKKVSTHVVDHVVTKSSSHYSGNIALTPPIGDSVTVNRACSQSVTFFSDCSTSSSNHSSSSDSGNISLSSPADSQSTGLSLLPIIIIVVIIFHTDNPRSLPGDTEGTVNQSCSRSVTFFSDTSSSNHSSSSDSGNLSLSSSADSQSTG